MSEQPPPAPSDATIAARGGWSRDFETSPSAPPLYLTTAFDIEDLTQLDSVTGGETSGFLYTRDGNPNHEAFASDVAALEGAELGMVAASGMGALTSLLMATLHSGDHVIAGRVLYGRTGQLLRHLQTSFGVDVSFVDVADLAAIRAARSEKTKLCIVESLTNPLVEVTDIPGVVEALAGVPLVVDNTFATPCLFKPLEHGATYVWHSASKYLNGHGDVMLGVLAGPAASMRKVRAMSSLYGVNSNPFESWLGSRGLRTLPLRMQRVSETAQQIAEFLDGQVGVSRVFYPGLSNHPTHHLARRLLPHGCGGMLAFELTGGRGAVDRLFRLLSDTIPFSPTLADARTTLSYPAGTSHKFMTAAERATCGIGEGLVRLSVGLEAADDLIRELGSALSAAG